MHEDVTVSQVEITLHVTDKQGRVVPNLGKQDFQLFVDGQPVSIEAVEWVGSISDAVPSRSTTIELLGKPAAMRRPRRLPRSPPAGCSSWSSSPTSRARKTKGSCA